jgi:hypothetical protein
MHVHSSLIFITSWLKWRNTRPIFELHVAMSLMIGVHASFLLVGWESCDQVLKPWKYIPSVCHFDNVHSQWSPDCDLYLSVGLNYLGTQISSFKFCGIYYYVKSQYIMAYFTSQTKILFAKHFSTRETILPKPLQLLHSSLLTVTQDTRRKLPSLVNM